MKKLLVTLTFLFVFASLAGAADYTETKLTSGSVRVYTFGEYKLHAYNTMDVMNDACYVIETDTHLIGIEGPAFKANIEAWKNYITDLKKPLKAVLLSYHANGGRWYGDAKSYATPLAVKGRTTGGIKALVDNLGQAFGSDFITDMGKVDTVIQQGKNTVAGMEFIITDYDEGFTIEIPAMNAIYVHMMGADSHSILPTIAYMDDYKKILEGYKAKNFTLILSSHHTPEDSSAVKAKIAYLEKTKEIARASKTAEEFTKRMKAEFAGYTGENYLDMTAAHLYQ